MSTRPSKKAGEHPQSEAKTAAPPEFPAELQDAIRAALSKKATNVVVLDLREGTAFTDFFLICSGQNARNVHAIVDAIEEALRTGETQRKPSHVEGYPALGLGAPRLLRLHRPRLHARVRASSTRSSACGAARSASRSTMSRTREHRIAKIARAATDAALSILLAPACAACQRLLDHPSRGCVCEACWSSVSLITPPVCDRCGDPLAVGPRPDLCRRCRRMPRAIDRGRAAGHYRGCAARHHPRVQV